MSNSILYRAQAGLGLSLGAAAAIVAVWLPGPGLVLGLLAFAYLLSGLMGERR